MCGEYRWRVLRCNNCRLTPTCDLNPRLIGSCTAPATCQRHPAAVKEECRVPGTTGGCYKCSTKVEHVWRRSGAFESGFPTHVPSGLIAEMALADEVVLEPCELLEHTHTTHRSLSSHTHTHTDTHMHHSPIARLRVMMTVHGEMPPFSFLLKHLIKVPGGGCSRMTVSPTANVGPAFSARAV